MSLSRQNHLNVIPKPTLPSKPKISGYQQKYQNSQASSYLTALGQQQKRKKTHSSHSFQNDKDSFSIIRPHYINVRSSLEQQQQQQPQQQIQDDHFNYKQQQWKSDVSSNPFDIPKQLVGESKSFLDISRCNMNENSMIIHKFINSPSPDKYQNLNYQHERNSNTNNSQVSGIASLRKSLESRTNQSRLNQSFERNEGNNSKIFTNFNAKIIPTMLRSSQERQDLRENQSFMRIEGNGRANIQTNNNLEKQNKKPLVENIIENILQGGNEEQRRELGDMNDQINFLKEQNSNLIALQQNLRNELDRLSKSLQQERLILQERNSIIDQLQKEIKEKTREGLPLQEKLKDLISQIFEVSFVSLALSKEQLQSQLTGESATFILLIQNKLKEVTSKLSPFVLSLNMESYLADKGNQVRNEIELEIIKAKSANLKMQSEQLISPQSKIGSAFPLKKKGSSSFESTQQSSSFNRMHSRHISSINNSYEYCNKNFLSFDSNEKEGISINGINSCKDQQYLVPSFEEDKQLNMNQQQNNSNSIDSGQQFEMGTPVVQRSIQLKGNQVAQKQKPMQLQQQYNPNIKHFLSNQELQQSQDTSNLQTIQSNKVTISNNNYNTTQPQHQQNSYASPINSYQIPSQFQQQPQRLQQQLPKQQQKCKQNVRNKHSGNWKLGNPEYFGEELCPAIDQASQLNVFSVNNTQPFIIQEYLESNHNFLSQQQNIEQNNSFGRCQSNIEDRYLSMLNTEETESHSINQNQDIHQNNQSQPFKEIQLSTLSPCFNGTSRENSKRSLVHSNRYSSLKNNNNNINNNNQSITGTIKAHSRSRLSQIQLANLNNKQSISYDAIRRVKTEADDNMKGDNDLGFAFSCNELFASEPLKEIFIAKHNYQGKNNEDIQFQKDDKIIILTKNENGWWFGQCGDQKGYVPKNYLTPLKNRQFS